MECRGCCRFSRQAGPWVPHLLDSEKTLAQGTRIVACGTESAFKCASLDPAANTCAIYASRPFECRLYPFVLNRNGARLFLSVDPRCPYIGELEGRGRLAAHAARLADVLRAEPWRRILQENVHLFQPYSGVRDMAELAL